MKLTVKQIIALWNGLSAIKNNTKFIPGKFYYHMDRNLNLLKPDIETLLGLDEERRDELNDQQVEINISQVSPDMLDFDMPNGCYEAIRPMIDGAELPEVQSGLAKLLEPEPAEPKTNGRALVKQGDEN